MPPQALRSYEAIVSCPVVPTPVPLYCVNLDPFAGRASPLHTFSSEGIIWPRMVLSSRWVISSDGTLHTDRQKHVDLATLIFDHKTVSVMDMWYQVWTLYKQPFISCLAFRVWDLWDVMSFSVPNLKLLWLSVYELHARTGQTDRQSAMRSVASYREGRITARLSNGHHPFSGIRAI